jgi:hypothetical protein
MGNRQLIRGVGASRRIATGLILATVAVLLIAWGCDSEPTPSAEVVAAGDIASCSTEGDEATAELVEGIDGTVLALGDEAYPRGTAVNFEECYGPSWGRFKGRTKPVPGNHEYFTEGARGYFEYSGKAAGDPEGGYYSYELGSWHVVALNSNCEEVRCGPGSPQTRWLKEDLAANDGALHTLTYMHHPRFSSGEKHGSTGGGWRSCGRRSTRRTQTWSSPATSTTTSASPRRIRRGGQTLKGASASSWLAPAAAEARRRARTLSPTARCVSTVPTASSSSPCTRRVTSGSLSPWRVKASPTQAVPSATERPVTTTLVAVGYLRSFRANQSGSGCDRGMR